MYEKTAICAGKVPQVTGPPETAAKGKRRQQKRTVSNNNKTKGSNVNSTYSLRPIKHFQELLINKHREQEDSKRASVDRAVKDLLQRDTQYR